MLTYLWIIDLYIFVFSEMTKKKKVREKGGDSDPPPAATFPDKKGKKKKKKNKNKDSEVRSHSLEASATEKSAPSRSRGKRYVLPKFSVILVFNSLLLLFTKLHLCNTSSNNNYSNSFLSSFQFR